MPPRKTAPRTGLTLRAWEKGFRAEARNDQYRLFGNHLELLELPGKPRSMLKPTILMVLTVHAYAQMDGRSSGSFLALQTYDPAESRAPYMMTFDLSRGAYARLLLDRTLHAIDLADLYGHPWHPYRTVGYRQLWISHPDWTDLTKREMKRLQNLVTDDLRFDYGEEELDVWFDDSNAQYLSVSVQDHWRG